MSLDDRTLIDAERASSDAAALTHPIETPNLPLGTFADGSSGGGGTLWSDVLARLLRNKMAVIALAYLAVVALLAVTAPLWVRGTFGDPTYIDTTTVVKMQFLPPSLAHPMGTDDSGRDIFARVVYGARVSLTVGLAATLISVLLGLLFGLLSGYFGGLVDSVVMRLTDVFLAFPYILLAILLISVMGMGIGPLLVAIGILGWTTIARVFRSSVIAEKQNGYVAAARALGASDVRIMVRHILPNALGPVTVYATMSFGGVILTEAALSFLGLGVQPPTPSWGGMLNEAQVYISSNPGLFMWPGLAIIVTVLAFVVLGDGLRDALDVKESD
jgi:peptide/nickel transport system permease protein